MAGRLTPSPSRRTTVLRVCNVHDVPIETNVATADILLVALSLVDALAAVAAIGGGLALATGLEAGRFPIVLPGRARSTRPPGARQLAVCRWRVPPGGILGPAGLLTRRGGSPWARRKGSGSSRRAATAPV